MRPIDLRAWVVIASSIVMIPGTPGRTDAQQRSDDQCLACHEGLDTPELSAPAVAWASDVHLEVGLTCTGCHGGDAVATDESTAHSGLLARPDRERIPELCGRCHSNQQFMHLYDPDIRIDQVETYYTSRHGELLVQGDPRVATCVDCHGIHGIESPGTATSPIYPANVPDTCGACHADDERMASYDIPTDQLDEYKTSIHWSTLEEKGDLSAPVCNDCHGNHGALPPGHSSIGRVCAECHFQIGEYFAMGAHDSVFTGHDWPGCATCHGNHAIQQADDELLGLGERSTCGAAGCHSEADEGGRIARQMLVLVDSLGEARRSADSILHAAEEAGMPVDQPLFELTQVQNAIVSARAIMHSVNIDSMRAQIDEGISTASTAYEAGESAFEELRVRRTGLAASALVIIVLIVGLLIRIRELGSA